MRLLSVLLVLWTISEAGAFSFPALPTSPSSVAEPSLPTGSTPSGALPAPSAPDEAGVQNAEGQGGKDAPDYKGLTQYLFHFPDTRLETLTKGKIPYLSVTNTELIKAGKSGQTEWIVPFSQESGSVTAATAMRAAWQRFEDRYYWRANVGLNNPALYITNCFIDFNSGLNTVSAQTKVTVSQNEVGQIDRLIKKYPFNSLDNKLYLDDYFPLPKVTNNDYCQGLNFNFLPEIPFMYLPGVCFTAFGIPTGVCIEGDRTNATNPAAPAPLYFNWSEADRRVQEAVKTAHSSYLIDYQKDLVAALFNKKNKYFFPLPWQSLIPNQGAIIAPIMNQSVNPSPFGNLAKLVKNLYQSDDKTKLYALNSYPYYFQSVARLPSLSAHNLPNRKDVLASPPGVWLFEEYKRLLPPTSLPFQEQMGYTTFFEAFNTMRTTLLPEPTTAKFLRPMLYYATGNLTSLTGQITVLPQPMRMPAYTAGLPFVGPQGQWDWKSVPEGYAIPRVTGNPLFDYDSVVR